MDINEIVTTLRDSRYKLIEIEPGKTIIGFCKQPLMVTPAEMTCLNPEASPLTEEESEWVWATGNRYVNRKDPAAQKYTGTNDYLFNDYTYVNAIIWVDKHGNKFWGEAILPEGCKSHDGVTPKIPLMPRHSMRPIHSFPFIPKTFEVLVTLTADGVAIIRDKNRLNEADEYYRSKPRGA